ncbi:MAG: aspartate aminotransferase family protein, partial [Candidatus Dormibacteria bacterium]
RALMEMVAPEGGVYQAGTLSGNPLATAAGLATLRLLETDPPYALLEDAASSLQQAFREAAARSGRPLTVNRVGSMLTPFFTAADVRDYGGARGCDTAAYAALFNRLRGSGVYVPPSQFEAWFVSVPLARDHMDRLLETVRAAFL